MNQNTPLSRPYAAPIALLGAPVSAEAVGLVEHLVHEVVIPSRKVATRPTSTAALNKAVGALLADLFDLQQAALGKSRVRLGAHGMAPKDFNKVRLGFARDIFKHAVDALVSAGYLQKTDGTARWRPAFGSVVNAGGSVTTFQLTPAVVSLAHGYGLTIEDWSRHWRRTDGRKSSATPDAQRLLLRAKRVIDKGQKQPAQDHPFGKDSPAARTILADLNKLNTYLGRQQIDGLAFTGLRRIFSNGDQPDFAWNKGGRYYSLPGGHRYEAWDAEMRCRTITINGEPVDEVDLRASHLTLLHGLVGEPFDANDDPYLIDDWPRGLVKAWVTQVLGSTNPWPNRWSRGAQEVYEDEGRHGYLQDEYAVRQVGAAVTSRHPLLMRLKETGLSSLDLQFHEAEILRRAMEDLMLAQDITVLPIHDALIVPKSRVHEATRALKGAFQAYVEAVTGSPCKAIPKVTNKGSG